MKLKWRCRLVLVTVLLPMMAGAGWCQPAVEVVEQTPQGMINWSRALIQAKGIVGPTTPARPQPNDRQADISEARRRAWRGLFDTAMAVRVQGDRTVLDLSRDHDVIAAKIEEMVKKARVVGQEYLSDGTVVVAVEMSLYGGFSQLVLPPEIKQIKTLKTVGEPERKPAGEGKAPSGDLKNDGADPFTGLVIDARGLGCLPALFPRIVDETGQEVYGSAFVSREFAVQQGMSGYAMDATAALSDARVAPRPLSVKGLRAQSGDPAAIVISNADGARVRSEPEHLSYLKTCDVVIVLD